MRSPQANTGKFSEKEVRRLAFDFVAQPLLGFEHTPWRRADGAVIQVRNLGVQRPLAQHRMSEHAQSL
jgi:hypothetical protein